MSGRLCQHILSGEVEHNGSHVCREMVSPRASASVTMRDQGDVVSVQSLSTIIPPAVVAATGRHSHAVGVTSPGAGAAGSAIPVMASSSMSMYRQSTSVASNSVVDSRIVLAVDDVSFEKLCRLA